MTARQIIQEIEVLPPQEFDEVAAYLRERQDKASPKGSGVKFLDPAVARPMIKEILKDHAQLFRKLAE